MYFCMSCDSVKEESKVPKDNHNMGAVKSIYYWTLGCFNLCSIDVYSFLVLAVKYRSIVYIAMV